MIEAAFAASKKSTSSLILEQLMVDRLQACQPDLPSSSYAHIPISQQGFTSNSGLSAKTKPGSPNSLTDFIRSENCCRVVSPLTNNAELLERPRCGFSTNQLPVLAEDISVSSGLKSAIVALRRTPPEITASAECMTIS